MKKKQNGTVKKNYNSAYGLKHFKKNWTEADRAYHNGMSPRDKNNNKSLGSSFDLFLEQNNLTQEANLAAVKKIISYELQNEMSKKNITQTSMAERLGTSRAGLKRLLDPNNFSITLLTLNRVAFILGKRMEIIFHNL